MNGATVFQMTSCRHEGRLPLDGECRRNGRLADRCGGPGVADNRGRRPAADISCLACKLLHFFRHFCSFLHHIGSSLVSFSRSISSHFRLPSTSLRYLFPVVLSFPCVASACVSTRRSDAQMARVLESEAKLLENLKEERRHPPLIKALHGNETVAEAETHLREALDALIRANAEMRATLENR